MKKKIDLGKMNDQEVRELLRATIERDKAEQARIIDQYKPHSGAWRGKPDDGQHAFHKSDSRVRLLIGGNQSGKTIAGAVESIWMALGIHPHRKVPVPNSGRIVASLGFEEGANQVIVPKLMEWMPSGVLKGKPKMNQAGVPAKWEFNNGSVINILSGAQDRMVFEGWTGHWCWIDEPPKKYIYDATRRGLLRNAGPLWFSLTPLAEPWLYNDLYEPWMSKTRDDIDCFCMDMYDNAISNGGFIPDNAIKEFEDDLPEEERDARVHGKFRFLSGRIYPMFNPDIHVIDPFDIPKDWPIWEGIDPHLSKPHAYCMWAITPDDQIIVCEEIYEKLTIENLAERIHQIRRGRTPVATLIDTSSETPDSISRRTPRSVLAEKGIRTRLAQKNNNVYNGIHIMRDLLTPKEVSTGEELPQFFVMSNCRRHCKEFLNYVQDDRDTDYIVKDKPRKIWDDMMDLDRYLVVESPFKLKSVGRVKYSNCGYGRKFADDDD